MPFRAALIIAVLFLLPFSAPAQTSPKQHPLTGTVTGHVYCADTNAPTRLAKVLLEPAHNIAVAPPAQASGTPPEPHPIPAADTALDGSFTLRDVPAGTYYLIAEKQGYLSPLAQFKADQLEKPSAADRTAIAKALQTVVVQPNATVAIEVRLERGAAVSGTIRFEDGSPAAGLFIRALHREKDNKWSAIGGAVSDAGGVAFLTDDRGQYRLSGLPSGVFLIEAILQLRNFGFYNLLGSASYSSSDSGGSGVAVYSGSSFRQRDATPFKIAAGEERTGEDLVMNIAKLHSVSGSLVAGRDGHVINGGSVDLLQAGDRTPIETSLVEKDDNTFHFAYVPEGDYIVQVQGRDVVREEVPNPPNFIPRTSTKETNIRTYPVHEQPLSIHADTVGLTISLPDKDPATAATANR